MITPEQAKKLTNEEEQGLKEWEAKIDEALRGHDFELGPATIQCTNLKSKMRVAILNMYSSNGWEVAIVNATHADDEMMFEFRVPTPCLEKMPVKRRPG